MSHVNDVFHSLSQLPFQVHYFKMNLFHIISGAVASLIIGRCYLRYWKWGRCGNTKGNLDGKVVLITGANSGLGKEAAKEFVKRKARVILACRDIENGRKVSREISDSVRCDENQLSVRYVDLASMTSIRAFVDDVINSENQIDILVNNAGVARCPLTSTEDGFEYQFGVNYLGHFLLTNLLMDKITNKIIMVSSSLYKYGDISPNFDDFIYTNLVKSGRYDPKKAYCDSKLAMNLFGRRLARINVGSEKTVMVVSPGMVWTNLGRHVQLNIFQKCALFVLGIAFIRTANEGVQTILKCALLANNEVTSGGFYQNCQHKEWLPVALNDELGEKLWKSSNNWVKIGTADNESS